MRRRFYFGLALIVLFALPLFDTSVGSAAADAALGPPWDLGTVSDGGIPFTGKGGALDVTLLGTFTANGSAWTSTGQTYAADFTPGSSFSVNNASTVSWTAQALVTAPATVTNVSFIVNYPHEDWRPTVVTNPDDVAKSTPADWTFTGGVLKVKESAVDSYGFWKIDFIGGNHVSDLVLGLNGGSLSETATFDIGDTMQFQPTESYLPGAQSEIRLVDPTGSLWFSVSDTNVGSTSHEVPSFRYKKVLTVVSSQVSADVTDFPVMFNLLDTDLHDTNKVQPDGDDILFVQNGIIVPHEIEFWNQNFDATRARLVVWVKANLSASVDTDISMYYGNSLVGPAENPEAVWSNGFQAVWHLDEDAAGGGTHYDSTSNSYDGIQSGNGQAGGRVGYGQYFDGTNDWIRIESTEGLDPVGSLTISGWFRLPYTHDNTTATSRLIMEKYLNNDDDLHIGLVGLDYASSAPAGTLVFKVENSYLGGSSARYVYTSRNSWTQNTWYYFSCRMDSANSANNRIYINGIENYGGIYGSNNYNNLTFSTNWGIGGRYVDSQFPGGEGWFNGYLDEFRVASGLRSSQWLRTEYFSQSSGTFYTVGIESERLWYEPSFTKLLDATAPAGLWTVSVQYRDVSGTVDFRAGEYERNFIVQHATSLSLVTPSIQARIAGELLYMEVSLTDTVASNPVTGASVSANWSVLGVPTNVNLEDYGDGRYGKTVDTSDLVDTGRWRINIQSSHPYYNDASTSFDVDITHDTELAYELVTTTPIGFDFTATLVYLDAFDGTTIDGATITFGD
ncbi:MAG: DUF2341 domain-containing protein, partial [Candidatus Sifarchaeia archaeon]